MDHCHFGYITKLAKRNTAPERPPLTEKRDNWVLMVGARWLNGSNDKGPNPCMAWHGKARHAGGLENISVGWVFKSMAGIGFRYIYIIAESKT